MLFRSSLNVYNLDNHNGNEIVKTNNIVCSIPIKEIYNGVISYENLDGGSSFCFRANKQEIIQNLCVSVKDCFGNYIPNFPDFHMIIQFQKRLNKNPYLTYLETINDYLLKILLFISSFIT